MVTKAWTIPGMTRTQEQVGPRLGLDPGHRDVSSFRRGRTGVTGPGRLNWRARRLAAARRRASEPPVPGRRYFAMVPGGLARVRSGGPDRPVATSGTACRVAAGDVTAAANGPVPWPLRSASRLESRV